MRRRISLLTIVAVAGFALLGAAFPAAAIEDCLFFVIWRADNNSAPCPPGQVRYRLFNSLPYECKSGDGRLFDLGPPQFEGAPEGCRIPYNLAKGYVNHSSECGPSASAIYDHVNACDGALVLPADCKNDATKDGSGCVGDPVNLRTGALSLDVVDLDLGGGLRFARHYASNALATNPPSSATLPGIGLKWSHSLYWNVRRIVPTAGVPIVIVTEPFRNPVPYKFDGTSYKPVSGDDGAVTVDPDLDVHFTNAAGVQADFNYNTADQKYYLTHIRHPGELPIVVTPGPASTETTFTRGNRAIVIRRSSTPYQLSRVTEYNGGAAVPGQQWNFTYVGSFIRTVVGPDPTTPATNDTTTWTYTPKTGTPNNRIALLQRTTTSNPTPVTLGSWDYGTPFAWWDKDGANRVISVDEQALDQPLSIAYSYTSSTQTLSSAVSNSSNQLLAVFNSKFNKLTNTDPVTRTTGAIQSVTNPTGPLAPVPGGAGVDVPFVAQTTISANNPLVKERTDKRGNKTLFENYDNQSRPGREVKGWVDGPSQPGVFSPDDSYAALDETVWHPFLQQPLIEYAPSVLPGGGTKTTIYDYDDPATPGDNPAVPNQAPTKRLYSRTDQGFTLDASGGVVLAAYKTTFTYDAAGRLKTASGPRPENFTEHFYDATTGYRTATRRHLNGSASSYLETTFSNFDSRGNPQTITDPNLQATQFTYDSLRRVKTVTPPFSGGSSTVTFTYDIDGNLTRIDFPPDSFSQPYFLRLGYDTKNRLTFMADAAGNAIVYERTAGRVTREALYSAFVSLSNRGSLTGDSTFSYDAAGRLLKAFNPLFAGNSGFTQYGSDANGNPTTVTDENGKQDSRIYDALDRLTQVSQVRGATTFVTQFDYDLQGRVQRVTDPSPKSTDYQHDDFRRLVKMTSPNSGVTLYRYDAGGNLVAKTENFTGSQRTTDYAYDGLDRLTLVDFPTTADWTFNYDGSAALNQLGRLSSVTNGVVTTSREYTARGDLALESTTIGGATYGVSYGYDASGNRISVQAPSGVTSSSAYAGGRVKTLTVTAGADQQVVRNITFSPFGSRTRAEFPPFNTGTGLNTVVSTRSLNLRGQVTSLQVTSPAGVVLDRAFDYSYTAGGVGPNDPGPNLDRVVDNRDSNESRFYFYDSLDRLQKSAQVSGAALHQYAYDANGNRTSEFAGGTAVGVTYEPGTDRVATSGFSYEFGSIVTYFHHDAYGNRIWEGLLAPYSGQPMYYYDDQNRLVEYRFWTNLTVPLAQYAYDAFGRRVRKITQTGTTLYFYDPDGQLLEERVVSTVPNAVRDYVWVEDEPFGAVDSGAQPVRFSWIHTDWLNNPIAVTSSPSSGAAQAVWRASYKPFGLTTVSEDPDGDSQPFSLSMRFPGQVWDAETGMHYNWHRYYDPSIGRYISADPIGQLGGLNIYAYASGDPVNRYDPNGLNDGFGSRVVRAVEAIDRRVKAATSVAGELFADFVIDLVFKDKPGAQISACTVAFNACVCDVASGAQRNCYEEEAQCMRDASSALEKSLSITDPPGVTPSDLGARSEPSINGISSRGYGPSSQ